MYSYLLSVAISFDQLLNTFAFGYPDETISSRAYRLRDKLFWKILMKIIDTIFFWDKKENMRHCQLAYNSEVNKKHSPVFKE